MRQKFEVPYNFDISLVDRLVPYKEFVDFVYMASYYEDGENSRKDIVLRGEAPSTWEEYIMHVNKIKENFDIGVLIQSGSTIELIDKYHDLGIKIFVLNDSELVIKAKEKYNDIRCILSITAVLSLDDIKNNDYSMYDEIVLFFNFCRQIQLLEELPKKYNYVLMVNSHCIYNCDRCLSHWNLNADTIEEYSEKVFKIIDGYCSGVYREDRAYIQPNDLVYFDEYISNYKLVDRLMPTDDIIYDIDKYTKSYEGTKKDISWYKIDKNYEISKEVN